MLAKEIKIKTLKRQREFIEKQLRQITMDRDDGDSAYSYVGYIYPEVIKHFEKEGFVVKLLKSDMLLVATRGLPMYLFTVGDIALSSEEMKQAEEYEPDDEEKEEDEDDDFGEVDYTPQFTQGLLS